jgi:hypothetical protein
MAEAVAYRDQFMDWLYEKAKGLSNKNVPVNEFAELVGLDLDGAYTLNRYCKAEGLVDDKASGMGNPCAMLTAYGIADVRERRRRREDPALRARACRNELLRWFYRQRIAQVRMAYTEKFAEDDGSLWECVRFTGVEIQNAAEYLADKGLIQGVTVEEINGPVSAEITSDGIDCATDWEGNVAEYLRDQRGYGPQITNHGPVFHGSAQGQQFAWGNRDVTQHQAGDHVAPGFEPLAEAVAEIIKQLPAYGLDPQGQQDAEEAASDVLAEVTQPQPEPRKVRRAVAALRGFLVPIATTAAQQEVQALAQHGIDSLNHAIGM